MKKVVIAALLILFVAPSVMADDIEGRIALGLSLVADYKTSRWAIKHGAHEGYVFGTGITDSTSRKTQIGLLAFHGALVEGLSIAAERDGHPKLAKWFRIINAGAHGVAAAWNVHVGVSQIQRGK